MCEELQKLSQEVRQIAAEIAEMKKITTNMEPAPEKKELLKAIRQKQYQALFYADKMTNLGRKLRSKK